MAKQRAATAATIAAILAATLPLAACGSSTGRIPLSNQQELDNRAQQVSAANTAKRLERQYRSDTHVTCRNVDSTHQFCTVRHGSTVVQQLRITLNVHRGGYLATPAQP